MKDILCIQFIFWIPYNVGVELATSEAEFRLHQRGAQALSQKHPQIIEQLAAETLWDDGDYHQDENLGPGPGGVLPIPSPALGFSSSRNRALIPPPGLGKIKRSTRISRNRSLVPKLPGGQKKENGSKSKSKKVKKDKKKVKKDKKLEETCLKQKDVFYNVQLRKKCNPFLKAAFEKQVALEKKEAEMLEKLYQGYRDAYDIDDDGNDVKDGDVDNGYEW